MSYPLEVRDRHAAQDRWGAAFPEIGPALDWPPLDGGAGAGALANWQAAGFNKPQRSGFIRTCPDRSTGSKPLEDLTLDGVSIAILKWVLKGILKRPLDLTARVTTAKSRPSSNRPSRLAYTEHEHRSHRFFRSIHAAFVWRSAQGNQVSRRARALCPTGHTQVTRSFRRPMRRAPPTLTRMTHAPGSIRPDFHPPISIHCPQTTVHSIHTAESFW